MNLPQACISFCSYAFLSVHGACIISTSSLLWHGEEKRGQAALLLGDTSQTRTFSVAGMLCIASHARRAHRSGLLLLLALDIRQQQRRWYTCRRQATPQLSFPQGIARRWKIPARNSKDQLVSYRADSVTVRAACHTLAPYRIRRGASASLAGLGRLFKRHYLCGTAQWRRARWCGIVVTGERGAARRHSGSTVAHLPAGGRKSRKEGASVRGHFCSVLACLLTLVLRSQVSLRGCRRRGSVPAAPHPAARRLRGGGGAQHSATRWRLLSGASRQRGGWDGGEHSAAWRRCFRTNVSTRSSRRATRKNAVGEVKGTTRGCGMTSRAGDIMFSLFGWLNVYVALNMPPLLYGSCGRSRNSSVISRAFRQHFALASIYTRLLSRHALLTWKSGTFTCC